MNILFIDKTIDLGTVRELYLLDPAPTYKGRSGTDTIGDYLEFYSIGKQDYRIRHNLKESV